HDAPRLHPPFNEAARRRAGFSDDELAMLSAPPSCVPPGQAPRHPPAPCKPASA
ncbi:MAG: hypothetical protein RIS88_42, partial [Pseudomonadota bacterium]